MGTGEYGQKYSCWTSPSYEIIIFAIISFINQELIIKDAKAHLCSSCAALDAPSAPTIFHSAYVQRGVVTSLSAQ